VVNGGSIEEEQLIRYKYLALIYFKESVSDGDETHQISCQRAAASVSFIEQISCTSKKGKPKFM